MKTKDMVARNEYGLTFQEEALVQNIVAGMINSAAATAAGFKFSDMKRGAARILNRQHVKDRLVLVREEAAQRVGITQDEVLEGFRDAIGDAKLLSDPTAQIAGWREIAKMLGFYAPDVKRVEISRTEIKAKEQMAELTEEDLLKIIDGDGAIEGQFKVLDS